MLAFVLILMGKEAGILFARVLGKGMKMENGNLHMWLVRVVNRAEFDKVCFTGVAHSFALAQEYGNKRKRTLELTGDELDSFEVEISIVTHIDALVTELEKEKENAPQA